MSAVRAVPLTLGGREWRLRCCMGGMAGVEDYGYTWNAMLDRMKEKPPSIKITQLFVWALMQDDDSPPTLREVGRWVDPQNFAEVLEASGAALRGSFPPSTESDKSDPPVARGTGSRSADSPSVRSPSSLLPSGA